MSVLSAAEQARDLERVMQMWRALGHTARSIDVYSMYVRLMAREARSVDYKSLCADRVVQLALAYAATDGGSLRSFQVFFSRFSGLDGGR